MARVYSHSRLSCFENCPRQFQFRYVLRVPIEAETIESFVGKQVHAILERLHQFVRGGRVPPLSAVLRRFLAGWDEGFDPARIRVAREGRSATDYRDGGERCLRNYYRRHYPFDREETLGLEERLSFSLDPDGRYPVQGVVDRLARASDGAIEIQDYKTGQRIPAQSVLDRDRQLALYQIGLNGRYGPETPVRLVWHYLLFDEMRTSTRTPEQLDELTGRTVQLIERIEAEERYDPRPGPLCAWCEYREICPASAAGAGRGARSEPQASEALPPAPAHQLGLFG